MGGIPLPALQARAPQVESPFEMYGRALQLKNLLTAGKMNQMRYEEMQQQREQEEKIDAIIRKHKGDIRTALPEIAEVAPQAVPGIQKQIIEWDKLDLERKIKLAELGGKRTKRMSSLAAGITDQDSYQAAIQQAAEEQLLDPQTAQKYLSTPYDPETVKVFHRQALTAKQIFDLENDRAKQQKAEEAAALEEPGKRAETDLELTRKTMLPARSQGEWTARRNFLKGKVSEESLALLPEQFSLEAARALKEGPAQEEKPEKEKDVSFKLAELDKWRTTQLGKLQLLIAKPVIQGGTGGVVTPEIAAQRSAIEGSYERQRALIEGKAPATVAAKNTVKMRAPNGQPASPAKQATRQQVERFASLKGMTYEQAKVGLEAEGWTVIE